MSFWKKKNSGAQQLLCKSGGLVFKRDFFLYLEFCVPKEICARLSPPSQSHGSLPATLIDEIIATVRK